MSKMWYYEVMGDEVGPVSSAELKKLAASQVIEQFTLIRQSDGATKTPAYRIKGLFTDNNIATESVVPTVRVAPTIQPSRPTRQKRNAPTLALAVGLCFFATTTIVLLILFINSPFDAKPVADTTQPATTTPPAQQAAAATPPQAKLEEPEKSPIETVAEPSIATSPDAVIAGLGKIMGVEAVFAIKVGDVTLLVGVDQLQAYVPKNIDGLSIRGTKVGFHTRVMTENSIDAPSAGFVPINGKPEEVKIYSSDTGLIKVFGDGSASVRGAGNASVFVECAGKRITIPIQIHETPFTVGFGKSNSKDVIEALGIPQKKETHVVSWPDSEIIDQMYYGPDVGSQRRGEHWEFDKLPGLSIQIVSDFVEGIGMRDRPADFTPEIIWQ